MVMKYIAKVRNSCLMQILPVISTTTTLFRFWNGSISWMSKPHSCARGVVDYKAEYMALTEACKEAKAHSI